MAYTFDPIFAADPSNPANVAANAAILIYDPNDAGKAPVTITDLTGSPLPNPVTVNKNGFGSAFQHATLDRLAWSGAGFEGFFTSYEGMKNVAVGAQAAAETAASNAAVAAEAELSARIAAGEFKGEPGVDGADGANVLPTDTAIANAVSDPASQTKAALSATYLPTQKDAADTFKGMTQRLNFGDTATAKGSIINIDHRGDGTGNTTSPGQAYGLDIHNYPGAERGMVGHQYSSVSPFMQLDNTGIKPLIELHNTQNTVINPGSDGTGDFILLRDHGTSVLRIDKDIVFRLGGTKTMTVVHSGAKAFSVQESGNFTAQEIIKTGTGAGNTLDVTNAGTGYGAIIRQNGAAQALRIEGGAGSAGQYVMFVSAQDYGPMLETNTNGGTTFSINKKGTGSGVAFSVRNYGTSNSVELRDAANAVAFSVGSTGSILGLSTTTVSIRAGAGSPEGVVTASNGSIYLRTDGDGVTSLYVKAGSGNTGWVAK